MQQKRMKDRYAFMGDVHKNFAKGKNYRRRVYTI